MTKTIVTLGPATNSNNALMMIKDKGVDFVRINMSHSNLDDLKYFLDLSVKNNLEFIIDTEGSQIRTGDLSSESVYFKENETVHLYRENIVGDVNGVTLRPTEVVQQLSLGDILYIDFDTLALRISGVDTLANGYVEASVISAGYLGRNKGVVIDSQSGQTFNIPTLTEKDVKAIEYGLEKSVKYVAASFIRSGDAVKEVRRLSNNRMKVISKVECKDALNNLTGIIKESDYLLIDRGDLSKEIPIEKIPFVQKVILHKAKSAETGVFVATNLLESMITNRKPTRAEVHDIINTIVDGAYGLTLAAETAIGKHPLGCINMLNKIIRHVKDTVDLNIISQKETKFVEHLLDNNYLLDDTVSSSLVLPHGGHLVNRIPESSSGFIDSDKNKSTILNQRQCLDLEQIAIGGYSPLEGFMVKSELDSVLSSMRLANGIIWPIPILLDVEKEFVTDLNTGDTILLKDFAGYVVGDMLVEDIYEFDKRIIIKSLYGDVDDSHPGKMIINDLKDIFLGGRINMYSRMNTEYNGYALSPRQTRRLFEEKNWTKVAGFHTRNVIHKAHEFIQLSALKKGLCDGLLIHPVVGQKKAGDFNSKYIIDSYELMTKLFYPQNTVVFSVFSTYSRYAGMREAIFTAICRQNYGCSHFIVGRDHTGVGVGETQIDEEGENLLHNLDIKIIQFQQVSYSVNDKSYIESGAPPETSHQPELKSISGSEARRMLKLFKSPPEWYMRKEISDLVITALKNDEEVFIR
jgi:pyruvate kinase